ncbi:hypothetical protein SARC_01033 [Sphaeroforma arctica JP610]|uniref:Saposin B-type domain-containing protein n=1 Tax=Sphaeroforma arctica JP610 TaxID=667725 RepID=A0A0L0GCU9_9EUKA|nr:hypothetical protein SARC_01033 [Sphaeroforma arctica JP610]KNC86840.1 hypothetical protein SARC_01033 [Sphaeroforma arctica JP610]|eukprot:XP_014160742.1 hypothetical protein SARC_01033 [Sphaeroforma arctica JP610]
MRIAAFITASAVALSAVVLADPVPNDQQTCDLCMQSVGQLHDPDTRAQLEGMLDQVCAQIPFFQDECKGFTGQIKDEIEKLAKETPREACEEIQLCGPDAIQLQVGKQLQAFKTVAVQRMKSMEAQANSAQCDVCKWLWDMVEQRAPPVEQLEKQLESVCAMAPTEQQDQCKDAVTQIEDQYRQGISMTPQEVCEKLQVCAVETPVIRQLLHAMKEE